ncbi:MAG: Ppx/GppA phosphatase family protein [Hyphomicrobiaceae bacterium]|nr:Ppx/GppA phosphatase family protein [Hyphomicrobiaceae bacterium]
MTELIARSGDRGRFVELEPIAVVDIGSNSVRLVVYEGAVRSPTPLFNEKVLCGLGRAVATTGLLAEDAMARALSALGRFRALLALFGISKPLVIATAAVRDAQNGPAFVAACEEACGCPVRVLSGEEEARASALGIVMGVSDADGFVGDLGGGSLELIDIQGSTLKEATTLPLGGLRLIDVTGGKLDKAASLIDREISRVPFIEACRARTFYAVGGTWRSIARMHMAHVNYPLHVMHGYSLPVAEAITFAEHVRKAKKLQSLRGITDISRQRREVLPYGALVLERLLIRLSPRRVEFSVFGVREGLIYQLLSEAERAKDPLLSFCEDYARLRSRSLRHAQELCAWTDGLAAIPGFEETPEDRRLRHAACLLSDIGWRAHPDYRGEQSLNVVAHAALSGIDHPGRVFLALAIYFRHVGLEEGGHDDLSARLKAAVSRAVYRRARILGCAIRAVHMLSAGMPGIVPQTRLTHRDDGVLVLQVPQRHASLDGERLRRRFGTLAELLNLQAEIQLMP